jgi:hypothetical protein
MFRACPNAFHKPTNHAVYVCFVPVFSLSLLSKSFVLMPCSRDWTPVRMSPMIPRRSIIPSADVRKQKPNRKRKTRESDDNDQSRGKCTPPSRLTIEVMSLPREEMFEILDSGCTGVQGVGMVATPEWLAWCRWRLSLGMRDKNARWT